jgi:segregation and condensation protein B
LDSILNISERFDTTIDECELDKIKILIDENNQKKDNRRSTKIKVYSNFLKDTILDMGFTIDDGDYDYIVAPDYLDVDLSDEENFVLVPSHKNVSNNILERVKERYDLLEREICMKR